MLDKREAILARLQTVAGGVSGVRTSRRNETGGDDTQLPLVSVLEGDEEVADGEPRGRNSVRPYVVTAAPQVFIRAMGGSVGTDLNTLRARIIDAVMSDTQLDTLSINGRGIRYSGMQSTLHAARSMLGATALVFTIKYYLDPADLT
jgi:hypothetical protein